MTLYHQSLALCFCVCFNIPSTDVFAVKETEEAEELDERDEEVDDDAVPVESESYVNLKKRMANRHNMKIENLLQENGKLCREFQRKQVKYAYCHLKHLLTCGYILLQHDVFMI